MTSTAFDFAVFGRSPLARLLAGLLAEAHGLKVAIVGGSNAAYRLARGVDLSLAPVTRPETWALLGQCGPEAQRLLARTAGRAGIVHIDPLFFAETEAGLRALGHVRHMASGHARQAERMPEGVLGPGREGLILRDCVLIQRSRAEAALDNWLETCGVVSLDPAGTEIAFEGGGAALGTREGRFEARRAVLADAEAVARHVAVEALGPGVVRGTMTSMLTEPTRPLPAPVLVGIDTGTILVQHASRALSAFYPGSHRLAVAPVGRLLGGHENLRRAGQTSFASFSARDGAMLCGPPSPGGPTVLIGLGLCGAFLAPALARWLAGAASPFETDYFSARGFGRDMGASRVAEISPSSFPIEEAQA